MNDREVISKVLEGDREAFALLIDRYKDMAFTIAFRMTGDRQDAEEILQESFIKAYSKLGHFRQEASFSTWFFRIVYNGTISFLRSRKKIVSGDTHTMREIVSEETGYFEAEEKDFRKNAVNWAISQLKPEERAIITLFYHEEKSLREIGGIIGMHEDAVKMKLHRARKKMKTLLENKFQNEFANDFI